MRTAKGKLLHGGGSSSPSTARWDYKEITVPLGLEAKVPTGTDDQIVIRAATQVASSISAAIHRAIVKESAEGWQLDESTDAVSLYRAGRLRWEFNTTYGSFFAMLGTGGLAGLKTAVRLRSVTVRIRRFV